MRVGGSLIYEQDGITGHALELFGDERSRRGVEADKEDGDVVGKRRDTVAHGPEALWPVVQIPERQRQLHDRADLVQLELELGHDPEITPTASDRPKEVRARVPRRLQYLAVRRHDLHRQHIVGAETSLADQPAHTAAEGQAGHASVTDEATGDGQTVLLGRGIQLSPPGAAPATDRPDRRSQRRRSRQDNN